MEQSRLVGFAVSNDFRRAFHVTATLLGVKKFTDVSYVLSVFGNLDTKMLAVRV
jgi:hypothetical protein